MRILNPTVAIEVALEDCRCDELGFGPQKLSTLASYALRRGLLNFLTAVRVRHSNSIYYCALCHDC